MTYNFDPDRWYENELAALEQKRRDGSLPEKELQAAAADLEQRYAEMLDRLDGTYRIPEKS
jgi:hypothetical protein